MASAAGAVEPVNLELAATAENAGLVTTTNDNPSDLTVDDGGLVADWSGTFQTTDIGFDADQDSNGSIGYFRFTSFDEVRTYSTEVTNGDAAATLTVEQLIVPHGLHDTPLTENSFAFKQTPMLDRS